MYNMSGYESSLYWSKLIEKKARTEKRMASKTDSVDNRWWSNSEGSVRIATASLRAIYEGIAEVYDSYTADNFLRNI